MHRSKSDNAKQLAAEHMEHQLSTAIKYYKSDQRYVVASQAVGHIKKAIVGELCIKFLNLL